MADEIMYKGRPIVRCKDTMYYGRLGDHYVVMLQVKSTRTSRTFPFPTPFRCR